MGLFLKGYKSSLISKAQLTYLDLPTDTNFNNAY